MASKTLNINEEELAKQCDKATEKAAAAATAAVTEKAFAEGYTAGSTRSRNSNKENERKCTLDPERGVDVDSRDPRALGEGPCKENHMGRNYSNQWGQWTECARCCLRRSYVPYTHSLAQATRAENPENVRAALRELREAGIWQDTQAKETRAKIREVAAKKMANFRKAKSKPRPATHVTHSDEEEEKKKTFRPKNRPTTEKKKEPSSSSTAPRSN